MAYRTTPATQERKDAKRRRIVEAAGKVFARRGYAGTAVKDIAGQARVSVGSVYSYFAGKEAVFGALFDEMSARMDETIDRAVAAPVFEPVRGFARATAAALKMYEDHQDLARIILLEAMGLYPEFRRKSAEKARHSRQRMEAIFAKLQARGAVHTGDVRVAALAFDGTFYRVVTDWLHDGEGRLTDAAFALAVYNLQALGIAHQARDVKRHVKEYLDERAGPAGAATRSPARRKTP